MIALLFASAVAIAAPKTDLQVSLINSHPESIHLTSEKRSGRNIHLITYRFGEKKVRERVVPDSIFEQMKSSFPKALLTLKSDCASDVSVLMADGKTATLCTQTWSKANKAAFAKWYTTTRDRIFD